MTAALNRLEERCREQGIRLIYGELSGEGGLCRLRDKRFVIINRRTSAMTRVRIIADALARLEVSTVPAQPHSEGVPAQGICCGSETPTAVAGVEAG